MLTPMEPDTSSNQRPVIQASEILAKIERGEDVEYDGVIVEGDLKLGALDLPTEHVDRTELENLQGLTKEAKIVKSPISITNSEIQGAVVFSNAIFRKSVDFKGANFSDHANFVWAKFSGHANFEEAKFSDRSDFEETKFGGYANFEEAKFSGYADFRRAKFSSYANFEEAKFSRRADFRKAKFSGYANFEGTKFDSYVYFYKAQFSVNADFYEAKFVGNADFSRAKFSCGADFGEAKFVGNADFSRAKFSGYANFEGAKLSCGADFSETKFSGDAYFYKAQFSGDAYFWWARFSGDVDFRDTKFDKELNLDNLKFLQLYITWNSIKDNLIYNGPAYLALIKNFKVIEQFSDADDCYYQYRKESQARKKWYSEENRLIEFLVRCYDRTSAKIKRISESLSWINNYPPFTWIHRFNWSKLLDWIGFVSCGYGVRIQPIILWVFGSVLGFTLLYKLLPQRYGAIAESGPSTVTMEAVNNSTLLFTFSSGDGAVSPSWGECLYFSFTALTGGTPDGLHPVGLCKYAVMFEGVLGYLFLALFVVVLARKIIR